MREKILLADEDSEVLSILKGPLLERGYSVLFARDGKEAYDLTIKERPSLVVIEVSLKELDGFSVCRLLKSEKINTRVMFLTNMTSEIHAVIGFEQGACDYIRKPLQIKEVMARVELHLRKKNYEQTKVISVSGIEINLERRKVKYRGEYKELTHKEFQLLYRLAQNPNKVFTREELLTDVWGYSQSVETRTVDLHMGYLRKKFEENPRRPNLFKTIRGSGYCLSCE